MGKILKRDRLQELEEINQAMQQENVELRRLVQIIEEDRERMWTLMLAMEARRVGGSPSARSPSPVRDDETHPFWRQSDEEDSYTPATPVEEQSIGEAIGTFSSPVESTDYTPASPVVDQEVESNHPEIAAFEKHTKGVGMRMLSKFGYQEGARPWKIWPRQSRADWSAWASTPGRIGICRRIFWGWESSDSMHTLSKVQTRCWPLLEAASRIDTRMVSDSARQTGSSSQQRRKQWVVKER
jgi:hypothetical protein